MLINCGFKAQLLNKLFSGITRELRSGHVVIGCNHSIVGGVGLNVLFALETTLIEKMSLLQLVIGRL